MGKSPGRWIKTVLFGKKPSKSNLARGKEKKANGNEEHVRVMTHETSIDHNTLEIHDEGLNAVHVDEQNSNSGYRETSFTQQDQDISETRDQIADQERTRELDAMSDIERATQENAAIKTQAAFRGYLARRAFKALKGIIRLQALIRGHLVRRQAVASLHCVIGIVKLQALVRGSMIRCSDTGSEVPRVCLAKPLDVTTWFHGDSVSTSTESLSTNAFIRKLLAPSPQGMPLRVQYDETDPNSVQIWLERWSISCPWKPVPPPKKATNSKTQKKQGNSQAAEGEIVRPKRSVRKVPSLFDNGSAQSTSELEKPRRNPKKIASHPPDSVQENPQNELEKVKRSLRKVHNPITESSAPAEVTERPSQNQGKTITSSVQEVPEPKNEVDPVENMKDETTAIFMEETITTEATRETADAPTETTEAPAESTETPVETVDAPVETNQSNEISIEEITKVKSESFDTNEKDENTPMPNGELKAAEENVLTENQKSSRRASFPAKQDHVEDGLQNTPKVPSYMQATQSAKAKLRGQGSPRLSQDSAEKSNVVRRHSLPSPANGKVNSASPRTPKALQVSGKSGNKSDKSLLSSGNKSDKSLLSSRDGSALTGKTTQGWRR